MLRYSAPFVCFLLAGLCFSIVVEKTLSKALLNNNPFMGAWTSDMTPIRVQMGKYEYAIPANYFDMQPDPSCNSLGHLLIALLPDFEGRTKKTGKNSTKWEKKNELS